MIISHFQAQELLDAKKQNKETAEISLDLNLSKSKVIIDGDFFIFPGQQKIQGSQLKKVLKDDTSCFLVRDNSILKIKLFSQDTNKFYKLFPTKDAPTIEISGIRMHTTKLTTPMQDTEKKLETIKSVHGFVLDTCMGLGYTAIAASKTSDFVMTCEKDENVIEIAKLNPWSKELFGNKKISILETNILEEIKIFKTSMFDIIIHDPPSLSLATELYSLEFYRQLFRVMKRSGKLYHYTGYPGSKNRNVNLAKNVAGRLKLAGFKEIKEVHYGLTAEK